jgi:hypothetical protein
MAHMTLDRRSIVDSLRPRIVSALAVLGAMVFVACGGSGSSSTASSQSSPSPILNTTHTTKNLTLPDVCTLVTADDVAKIWNVDKSQVATVSTGSASGLCLYGLNSASNAQNGLLILGQSYPDAATAQAVQPDQLSSLYSQFYGISNARSVSGIGDKAFEYNTTSTAGGTPGAAIFAFKSNILLMIILSPASDTTGVESLAKTALSRLA